MVYRLTLGQDGPGNDNRARFVPLDSFLAMTNDDIFDAWHTSLVETLRLRSGNGSQSETPGNATRVVSRLLASMETTELAVGITELIVFALGTPANLLVLYLACCILAKNRRKQYCQWLVLTMTAFDLMFCLIHGPMMFAQLVLKSPFTIELCTFMHFCTHTSATGSSLSLLLLNLDKFIHLYKPLHYPSMVTKRRTIAASIFVSLVSFSWASFLMFGPVTIKGVSLLGQCWNRFVATEVYLFLIVMFFILPTLASLAISVFTATVVIRSRKSCLISKKSKNDDMQSGAGSQVEVVVAKRNYTTNGRHKEPSESTDPAEAKRRSFIARFKIIGFVFTTTVWSTLTCIPYRIGYVWYVTRTTPLGPIEHFRMYAMFTLMVLNAAGNPFVTIVTQHQYTKGVGRLVRNVTHLLTKANDPDANANSPSGSKFGASAARRSACSPSKLTASQMELNRYAPDMGASRELQGQTQTFLSPIQRVESKRFKKRLS